MEWNIMIVWSAVPAHMFVLKVIYALCEIG